MEGTAVPSTNIRKLPAQIVFLEREHKYVEDNVRDTIVIIKLRERN